ncbi:PucR family transcriptional regulator [Haloechinothrix halophila]|uniref:PucR family transcriptional regulator n=1 Tax=Haloechinothrix halophila TaxID=1069073 RepID=UPI0004276D13|nr:PucR family transcriptional regulator [Haloechinothrix halophila]
MSLSGSPSATDTDDVRDGAVVEERVARAWASLLDQADAIADSITLTLLEKDRDFYETAPPELRADVRDNTREHVRRGIRTMAGLASPDEKAVHVWRETGRRRARQGVPMELVLNAYSLGTRVLWEALLHQRGNAAVDIDDHVLLLAGQRIWHALDVQNATLVESYRRESARLQRRDLQRQQSILDGLAEGRGADPEFAGEAREVLAIDADEPLVCVVAAFDDLSGEPLHAPEDKLERAGATSHWHVRAGTHFGLVALGELAVSDLVELLRPAVAGRVGVALSADGFAGFATAYLLAARAADTVARGSTEIVAVTDRLPEVLLAGNPEVTSLVVDQTLGPLLAQPSHTREVLVTTLTALLAHDGSPTHAAEDLYCHRNTVIYRLKQIESLTGRSLQNPQDKLLFSLGLAATGRWRAG